MSTVDDSDVKDVIRFFDSDELELPKSWDDQKTCDDPKTCENDDRTFSKYLDGIFKEYEKKIDALENVQKNLKNVSNSNYTD
jgi:bacterioferritin (cytochrome b1)